MGVRAFFSMFFKASYSRKAIPEDLGIKTIVFIDKIRNKNS